jgi:hypothetical protein
VLVESDFKIEIGIPEIGLSDEQFAQVNKVVLNAIRDIKMMAILYFASWIKSSPIAHKIHAICGELYYDNDPANTSYIRLYVNGNPVGERLFIGVGSYYLDGGKALFPKFGPLAGRLDDLIDSQPPEQQ